MVDATYDEVLTKILVQEKSIFGFLSTIFRFLARRTDFYYVPEAAYENIGFPPGVAEEIVIKVLRQCDPKFQILGLDFNNLEIANDILPTTTVAHEVEITSEENEEIVPDSTGEIEICSEPIEDLKNKQEGYITNETVEETCMQEERTDLKSEDPKISADGDKLKGETSGSVKESESYNGAVRDKFTWSQKIQELGVTIQLPPNVKCSKDLRVKITADAMSVYCIPSQETIVDDKFSYKIKTTETVWTLSEGRLQIHLEKYQERWWASLLQNEPQIDLSNIDCSRPLDELPEDHIAKVRELQWNHEQKMLGKPTSEEIKQMNVLKKAWDLDGSPFKGKPFDPELFRK